MKIDPYGKKVEIGWRSSTQADFTLIDVIDEYQKLGGKVDPTSEIYFTKWFPGSGYQKTALTNSMPPEYLCAGSMSMHVPLNDGSEHGVAISVYYDQRGHDPTLGDHFNIYLQHDLFSGPKHRNNIPNRHIPKTEDITLKAFVDGIEVESVTIKFNP